MNCPDCDKEVHGLCCSCGWVKAGTSKIIYRNTESHMPTFGCITREQFGLGLYNAVQLIGEIKQLRVMLGRVAMGELKPSDYKQREGKAVEQLRTCLLQLKPDDVVEVTNDYPWVAAL